MARRPALPVERTKAPSREVEKLCEESSKLHRLLRPVRPSGSIRRRPWIEKDPEAGRSASADLAGSSALETHLSYRSRCAEYGSRCSRRYVASRSPHAGGTGRGRAKSTVEGRAWEPVDRTQASLPRSWSTSGIVSELEKTRVCDLQRGADQSNPVTGPSWMERVEKQGW